MCHEVWWNGPTVQILTTHKKTKDFGENGNVQQKKHFQTFPSWLQSNRPKPEMMVIEIQEVAGTMDKPKHELRHYRKGYDKC